MSSEQKCRSCRDHSTLPLINLWRGFYRPLHRVSKVLGLCSPFPWAYTVLWLFSAESNGGACSVMSPWISPLLPSDIDRCWPGKIQCRSWWLLMCWWGARVDRLLWYSCRYSSKSVAEVVWFVAPTLSAWVKFYNVVVLICENDACPRTISLSNMQKMQRKSNDNIMASWWVWKTKLVAVWCHCMMSLLGNWNI